MIWLTERQSRYLIPVTMPDGYTADAALAGLIEGFDTIPDRLRRSVTFDQGPEWANWTPCRPLQHRRVVLRPPLAVATRPDREPQPPSALVVPPRHRPPPRHPCPSRTRRKHHQQPAPPQPQLPNTSRTVRCPHRALTTGTGRPNSPLGAIANVSYHGIGGSHLTSTCFATRLPTLLAPGISHCYSAAGASRGLHHQSPAELYAALTVQ